jgi:DNA (cytosine-5)-methyltransferase 1
MTAKNNQAFTFIDLFAGIGGFRLALERLGGHCANFSEIHSDAINTYCTNFGESEQFNLGDITQIKSLPTHDILTAGVPCQSWSIAGKNLGFDDDRGQLWNDTIYLLNQSRPKAFIFENVKGLADPRNQKALSYILARIHAAGYCAKHFVLNSSDYGVPQDRVRVYIVGFLNEAFLRKFRLPPFQKNTLKLIDILQDVQQQRLTVNPDELMDLFGDPIRDNRRYRKLTGMNDFFLFNDIRNGPTTIHSWDLIPTTERQQQICYLLLRNRRKPLYGKLDGNPLALSHFQRLDNTIRQDELEQLVKLGIFKKVDYTFAAIPHEPLLLEKGEQMVLTHLTEGEITLDALKECRELKKAKIQFDKVITSLIAKQVLICTETRYEFRYTKISTGIEGVNRVFLPKSEAFPTLVASDTNDFVALKGIEAVDEQGYKQAFLDEIFHKKLFRKISKEEACLIQGFPKDFKLPESRSRWMNLIGNSVSVPVIQMLGQAIIETGCLGDVYLNKRQEYVGFCTLTMLQSNLERSGI